MDSTEERPQSPGDALAAAIVDLVEPGEHISNVVDGVGCRLVLTDRRLVVVRDGASFRPRSGIREWPLSERPTIRYGLVRHGTGSVAIQSGIETTNVFVKADAWDAAIALVAELRRRVGLSRRGFVV